MTTKSPDPFWLGPVGLDTSKYQGKVNWVAVKQAGFDFVFIKASEGVGYKDPEFARSWNEARAAGLLVGAYHFARVSRSPTIEDDARKEAEWFTSLLSSPADMLPPMLDIEWDKHADKVIPGADVIKWCEVFTQTIGTILHRTPGIYTGRNFWRFRLLKTSRLSHLPLWQVHYTSAVTPAKIEAWKKWTFWQWSYTQPLPGSPKVKVDANRFNGSHADLEALANPSVIEAVNSGAETVVEEIAKEPEKAPWWEALLEITNSVTRSISENARRGG
jgi:lysozyme